MDVRTFLAPDGRRWRVWLVRPNARAGERRQALDRRQTPVEEVLDPPVFERRRSVERRTTPPSGGLRVTPLPERWRQGWLVFEPEDGDGPGPARRRLAPVPECWRACSERELAEWWARAEPSTRVA